MIDQRSSPATKTKLNLKGIAHSDDIRVLSDLTLPEIDAVVDLVGNMVPAGNVPGMILNVLGQVARRHKKIDSAERDVNILMSSVERNLGKAMSAAMFAGPAAAIWGYQNLLRLVGKSPDDAFPDGTWQFYVSYAMREDTARHNNETHGFDTRLKEWGITLDPVDRITAWVMSAQAMLHQYDQMLENEWRERVYLTLLSDITANTPHANYFGQLNRIWDKRRPYRRPLSATNYPDYRRSVFEDFVEDAMRGRIKDDLLYQWLEQAQAFEEQDLNAYQAQMAIASYLESGEYNESKVPIAPHMLHVAVIHQGVYYLIPITDAYSQTPATMESIREQVAALYHYPAGYDPANLVPLARMRRAEYGKLWTKLNDEVQGEIRALRLAPIILNFDQQSPKQPLIDIRQAERGVGDHAVTVFDAQSTFVFDVSHIYFDGIWGVAFGEIMTNEAIYWADQLSKQPKVTVGAQRPYAPRFQFDHSERLLIGKAPMAIPEVSAETSAINLDKIHELRALFRQRSEQIRLTVNDLLVLHRAFHALRYEPDPYIVREIEKITEPSVVSLCMQAITPPSEAPATMIPIDATKRSPRDRLYPMSFQVPLDELDILSLHTKALNALEAYEINLGNRADLYSNFEEKQRYYLATLAGFATVLGRARDIANMNQTANIASLKLIGHLPMALQHLLNQLPNRIDILNDLLRGREVLSNVGAVVPSSSLTRFTTAKDDNELKTLGWGILTDASGKLTVTLRDFRPHVGALESYGNRELAVYMAQDYVESYAHEFNRFVTNLLRIASGSWQTSPSRPAKTPRNIQD